MPSILDTVTSLMESGLTEKASRALDIEPSLVSRGLSVLGPVVLGGITKATASPAGANAVFNALPKETGGDLLSSLTGMFTGGSQNRPASILESLFGAGTNAIGATLSEKLGFNVR